MITINLACTKRKCHDGSHGDTSLDWIMTLILISVINTKEHWANTKSPLCTSESVGSESDVKKRSVHSACF